MNMIPAIMYDASAQINPLPIGKQIGQRTGTETNGYDALRTIFYRHPDLIADKIRRLAFAAPAQNEYRSILERRIDLLLPEISGFYRIDVQENCVACSGAKKGGQRFHQSLVVPAIGNKYSCLLSAHLISHCKHEAPESGFLPSNI